MKSPIFRLLLTCWMGTFCRGADPTSGLLRSAKYENMQGKFDPAENDNSPTIAPTALPALLPTSASAVISTRPTAVSTMPLNPMDGIADAPIEIPSRRPVSRPIGRPTRRPTSLKVSMERSVPTSAPTATIVSNIQVTEVRQHLRIPCHDFISKLILCLNFHASLFYSDHVYYF